MNCVQAAITDYSQPAHTLDARQRAHKAHMERRRASGWANVTVMFTPQQARTLDAYRAPDESRPAALKRLLTELMPR